MKRENPDIEEQAQRSTTEDHTFVLKSKFISREEAIREPILVAGFGLPDERLVYVFNSDEDFAEWSKLTIFGDQISRVLASIAQAQKQEGEDLTAVIQRRQAKTARIFDELQELSERTGLAPGTQELFLR